MQKEFREHAVKLFVEKYGETPERAGLPVISMWGNRRFLYAASEKDAEDYKNYESKWGKVLVYYLFGIVITAVILLILSMTGIYTPVVAYNVFINWALLWLEASILFLALYCGGKLKFKKTIASIAF